MASNPIQVSSRDAQILNDMRNQLAGIAGDGVANAGGGGISIYTRRPGRPGPEPFGEYEAVTVTGSSSRPGVYTGYIRRPVKQKFDPSGTGTLNGNSINEFGEIPSDTSEIYILNASEEGTSTHALMDPSADDSRTHIGKRLSLPATDGKLVFLINGSTAQAGCS